MLDIPGSECGEVGRQAGACSPAREIAGFRLGSYAMSYTVARRTPTPEEHRQLSESVGWAGAFWWEAMPASLLGSTCGVVVHQDSSGDLVGMGRVVGDGAFYFYIQDVAVHPDHQGRGLGRTIVNELVDQITRQAPGHCFVGLFATADAEALYRKLGWREHEMRGMWKVLRP